MDQVQAEDAFADYLYKLAEYESTQLLLPTTAGRGSAFEQISTTKDGSREKKRGRTVRPASLEVPLIPPLLPHLAPQHGTHVDEVADLGTPRDYSYSGSFPS